ncbi:hypothetical protein [Flavobacterium sp. RS13.1]|jgi:hypothetical protein|uniref:hypothetical protein n=1 Tax=Flavobacterium sp. RS13.1 TaxID=3400345 RepID=UPI003AAC3BC6
MQRKTLFDITCRKETNLCAHEETNETEKLQKLQKLTAQYFTTLKPTNEANSYSAQFKAVNYLELGCIITDLLKLRILALDNDMHNFSKKDKSATINVSLVSYR